MRHLPRKILLRKFSWWTLWVGDPKNFNNSFFGKSYYMNLSFFKYSRVLSLTKKERSSQNRCKPTKNCLTYIARDRRKTLEKEKQKWKMRESQTTKINIFLLLLFFALDFDSNGLIFLFYVFQRCTFNLEKQKRICQEKFLFLPK